MEILINGNEYEHGASVHVDDGDHWAVQRLLAKGYRLERGVTMHYTFPERTLITVDWSDDWPEEMRKGILERRAEYAAYRATLTKGD